MLTKEEFLAHLRDALNHLYDPHRLCRSPLANLFGVANRFDTPSALQHILTEAIASFEPGADVPSQSRAWRIYDLLSCRYVQQRTAQMVADQLGVTVRHLRREQRAALEALAYRLWEQFELDARVCEDADVEAVTQAAVSLPTVNEELAWLKYAPLEEPTNLEEALPATVDLVRPLAGEHGVRLEITTADALPGLAVPLVALRQTLLNLLSVAIHRAVGGKVYISARSLRWEVEIQVRYMKPSSGPKPVLDENAASLEMAHRLVDLCRGRLTLSEDEEAFIAILTFPASEQLPVLAIDDNADTLRLLQRYTAGTRYRLIPAQDPEQALSLVEKFSPQIIVLDVMMPHIDGWEVLARLRQHPLTGYIPIVVCTVLAQEELALSLGANGFVRKPVTRRAFLAALDHQIELMGPESR